MTYGNTDSVKSFIIMRHVLISTHVYIKPCIASVGLIIFALDAIYAFK